jgi:hypothetical protein
MAAECINSSAVVVHTRGWRVTQITNALPARAAVWQSSDTGRQDRAATPGPAEIEAALRVEGLSIVEDEESSTTPRF